MNKEVIYLEPEDDITDILTKLQQAEQKLVALVPPKKTTMLRSAVNMKLVARVAKECEKIVVIITADPAIVKMAMSAHIPVAKTLTSRPVIPTEASVKEAEANNEQVIDDFDSNNHDVASTEAAAEFVTGKDSQTIELDGAKLDQTTEKKSKKKKSTQSNPFLKKYGKWLMIGAPVLVVLVIVLVWALVFAPAATITVAISSTSSNFSENVSFVAEENAAQPENGVFYAVRQNLEQKYTTEFEATGEENRGDKATGKILVNFSFIPLDYIDGKILKIDEGSTFVTTDGLSFRSTESVDLSWDGQYPINCANGTVSSPRNTCVMSATIDVEAAKPGEEYNISAGASWRDHDGFAVSNPSSISGGTTDMVKVVSQKNIDTLVESALAEHSDEGRKMLLEDMNSSLVPIEASFLAELGEFKSTPAVDEVVDDDAKPSVTITIVFSIYAVDRSQIETFIKARTNLASDQKLYSIGSPYFERFSSMEDPARLKSVIAVGPIVSEDAIYEKAKGRKTGEVQSLLRSINGVSSVTIRTSFFWVTTVPEKRSHVTIIIEGEQPEVQTNDIEDQDLSDNSDTTAEGAE